MIDLDRYSRLDSPVHRLEPRSRLVGFGALIAGFALFGVEQLLDPLLDLLEAGTAALGQLHTVLEKPEGLFETHGLVFEARDDLFELLDLILEPVAPGVLFSRCHYRLPGSHRSR